MKGKINFSCKKITKAKGSQMAWLQPYLRPGQNVATP